jgi:hypothetical protein
MPYFRSKLVACAVLCSSVLGCRGGDIEFDCENRAMAFLREAEAKELPLRDIPETQPYPVALTLSEAGLNELVKGIISEDVPLAGTVPFAVLPQGPGELKFETEALPTVVLREVRGCPNCIVLHIDDFGVGLTQEGDPLASGSGFADLAVPLVLQHDAAAGTTTLVADYSQAKIDAWSLSVFGFSSEENPNLAGALKLLLEEEIQANFGPIELLSTGSWSIGAGEVALSAREVIVQPELKQLVLGMHTNLPLAPEIGLDINVPLPEDTPMGVAMDVRLMLAMAYRMLEEGEIPRRYDEDGEADADGIYGLTLENIGPAVDANGNLLSDEQLVTRFRVWRTAEGYCGYGTFEMPLTLAVNEMMSSITVAAGDAVLIPGKGEGFSVAAEEEKKLVDENQDLVDTFRKELTEQVGKTLNYEELDVEGSRILFTTQDVVIGPVVAPSRVDTFIDFLVLALPDDGETGGE